MSYQSIGLGSAADDGTGDSLRAGGTKVNANFSELYNLLGTGTALVSSISADGDDVTFIGAAYNVAWDKSASALAFADNAKALFGTGNDLEIYHDGSNSYIKDAGTGNLRIQATELVLEDASGNDYFYGVSGGSVTIHHNGSGRLATSASGIEVSGTVVTSGNIELGSSATLIFEGAAGDAYETVLTVVDPTADRTITIPNSTGTLITTGDTGVITSTMIADGTITANDLANGSVTTAKLAGDAVTGAKIADDAIDSEHYAADSIDEEHMANDAISSVELKTLSTLLIKNSSGSTLKTFHCAGV